MRRLGMATAAALAALYACGGDGGAGGGATEDAGGSTPSLDGGNGKDAGHGEAGHVDAGPVAAPYGLDARPSNKTCVAPKRPGLDTGVALQRMWSNLSIIAPVAMMQAPGDNDRWYLVDLYGKVISFPTAAASDADVTTFVNAPVAFGGEGGLLGMAFHPDFQKNHEVYLAYTRNPVAGDPPSPPGCNLNGATAWTEVVTRWKSLDGGMTLAPTPDEILKIGHPYNNHNGGNLAFGPFDGMLYVGLGDGGGGNDPCHSGQDLGSPLGKMLRIDVNAGPGKYVVPKDNPFFGSATTLNEIYAYGLRNPWRWSFDPPTGDLWVGDVGQGTWEEIDRVVAGGNYGWSVCEGAHLLGDPVTLCNTPGLIDPVVELGRTDAQAITGGYVYRGSAMPSLIGTYIFGDFSLGSIWALTYDADNKPVPRLLATVDPSTLASFAVGNDGELYALGYDGRIFKIVPATPPAPDTFPKLLSQTGCVDPKDATKPAAGVIPYDLNSPLWSDGSQKGRYFAIPDGTTIDVGADGDWELPIGGVATKTFEVLGKAVETRLFVRHDDGKWAGYTYEWNDQGTDATLLPGGKSKVLANGQRWTYPSRTQCLTCHNAATGGTIGLEHAQLNRDLVYAQTNRISNELATLDHLGLFTTKLGGPPSLLPMLPPPSGAAPVDARARSYLHANCAFCHRPGGSGLGTMDLRYAGAFAATNTCNASTTQGAVGGSQTILVPGDAAASVMSLRMHATGVSRMPPLAVTIPDPMGTKLVDQWINGVATCP
jgi:uncharacterized repeat protein (TIGR03806 family)